MGFQNLVLKTVVEIEKLHLAAHWRYHAGCQKQLAIITRLLALRRIFLHHRHRESGTVEQFLGLIWWDIEAGLCLDRLKARVEKVLHDGEDPVTAPYTQADKDMLDASLLRLGASYARNMTKEHERLAAERNYPLVLDDILRFDAYAPVDDPKRK
ncbi:hypothetical protein BJ508DRAFT_311365 [Ascobolus immersus RN42]|uniref:Uncharacterized protein n=1 Tax=Ascobolus immersus RN42 TaxID=1160509 RepID=A0A3N4HS65_ASCIM|nr:hypothetical protein BJ508DRAFT_311365 [Ascobolus immersus RN42]